MSSTRQVLEQFFDGLRNLDRSIDRIVNLFAEDGVSEFPYLATLGLQSQLTGPAEIRAVWELIRSKFSAFTLSKIDVQQTIDPEMLFVEYHAEGTERETGRFYAQDYRLHQSFDRQKRQDQASAGVPRCNRERSCNSSQWPRGRAGSQEALSD